MRLPQPFLNLILIFTTVIVTVHLLHVDFAELVVEGPFAQSPCRRVGVGRLSARAHDLVDAQVQWVALERRRFWVSRLRATYDGVL